MYNEVVQNNFDVLPQGGPSKSAEIVHMSVLTL